MALRLTAVGFEAENPAVVGEFWGSLLGRTSITEAGGVYLPGTDRQVGLRFTQSATPVAGQRLHLHVTSSTPDEQRQIAQTALQLGGTRRGSRPLPIGKDIYLNDPEGYDFCVIEPTSTYLAGCGPLGEVTCEGSRAAGLFWHAALQWPLVWDEGEQTAIQSPSGGTKIAWDAASDTAPASRRRQWFDLAADDVAAECARLVDLGATLIGESGGRVQLEDPDGVEFSVSQA